MCSGVEAERAGLYLHVPFCRSKCAYCDFYSRPGFDDEVLDRFAAAMQRDISVSYTHLDVYKRQAQGRCRIDEFKTTGENAMKILAIESLSLIHI